MIMRTSRATDIVAEGLTLSFDLHLPVPVSTHLPLAGLHNVRNACAAAAIATHSGHGAGDIKAGA